VTTNNNENNLSQHSIKEMGRMNTQFRKVVTLLLLIQTAIMVLFLLSFEANQRKVRAQDLYTSIENTVLKAVNETCAVELARAKIEILGCKQEIKPSKNSTELASEPKHTDEPKDPPRLGKTTGQGKAEPRKTTEPKDPPPSEKHTGQDKDPDIQFMEGDWNVKPKIPIAQVSKENAMTRFVRERIPDPNGIKYMVDRVRALQSQENPIDRFATPRMPISNGIDQRLELIRKAQVK